MNRLAKCCAIADVQVRARGRQAGINGGPQPVGGQARQRCPSLSRQIAHRIAIQKIFLAVLCLFSASAAQAQAPSSNSLPGCLAGPDAAQFEIGKTRTPRTAQETRYLSSVSYSKTGNTRSCKLNQSQNSQSHQFEIRQHKTSREKTDDLLASCYNKGFSSYCVEYVGCDVCKPVRFEHCSTSPARQFQTDGRHQYSAALRTDAKASTLTPLTQSSNTTFPLTFEYGLLGEAGQSNRKNDTSEISEISEIGQQRERTENPTIKQRFNSPHNPNLAACSSDPQTSISEHCSTSPARQFQIDGRHQYSAALRTDSKASTLIPLTQSINITFPLTFEYGLLGEAGQSNRKNNTSEISEIGQHRERTEDPTIKAMRSYLSKSFETATGCTSLVYATLCQEQTEMLALTHTDNTPLSVSVRLPHQSHSDEGTTHTNTVPFCSTVPIHKHACPLGTRRERENLDATRNFDPCASCRYCAPDPTEVW